MKRTLALQVALMALIGGAFQAKAASVSLADWCVNLNGDTTTVCNGGTTTGNAIVNTGSFDKTLEPGSNTLGTITVNLAQGAGQYVSFYADYDVDYAAYGSFQDSGKTVGTQPAGVSYELADPNSGNLFSDFAAGPLPNTNSVPTAAGSPNPCCDVAFALSAGGINVPAGGGTVTFTVSGSCPVNTFCIQQTNFDTGDTIFLDEVTNLGVITPPTAPEPASIFLIGLGLGGWRTGVETSARGLGHGF